MPVDVLTRIEIRRPPNGVAAFAQDPDGTPDGYETSARWSGRRPRRSPWAARGCGCRGREKVCLVF